MTKAEALEFVNAEIERIERANEGGELRPWEPDACLAAAEHWKRVQQRIFLETQGKRGPTGCCEEFHLPSFQSAKRQEALKRAREKRW